MKFTVVLKPRAVKDLKGIDLKNRKRILKRIEGLKTIWTVTSSG
jgi:mRNA-degrading endonuclease RelE of RelBE toxin-antitoxin system